MTSSRSSLYDSFALYASGLTLITVRDGSDDQFFVAGSVLTIITSLVVAATIYVIGGLTGLY